MVVYPRWRGELVLTDKNNIFCGGLSPLARGTRRERDSETPPGSVYPRWRGELCRTAFCICTVLGLSPLARGTPLFILQISNRVRFIPAGAGNSCAAVLQKSYSTVYPRWRGELSKHNLLLINDFLSQSQSTNFTVSHKQHIHYVKEHLTH